MDNTSTMIDLSRTTGLSFVVYSAEHLATLTRTWTEHPWHISKEKAFTLCDQCGWTIMPGEEELFSIPIPNGDNNGTIRFDFINPSIISGIDIELTPRSPRESTPKIAPVVQSIYSDYISAISGLYGKPITASNEVGQSGSWALPNHVSLTLILNQTYLKIRIHSPAQTDRIVRSIHNIADHRSN